MRDIKKRSSIMKGIKRAVFTAFSLITAVSMSACGGGGGGAATPTPTNAVVNKGVIDSFGSIFVNGVEFKTDKAIVHLRDDNITKTLNTEAEVQDVLKKGMVVTVKGLVDDTGLHGIAQEVEFRNTLKAKIDINGIDLVNKTITVMGQKIHVDDPAKFIGLAVGDLVEISGLPDDNGQIKATHLEEKTEVAGAEFEAKGFVKPINATSFTLLLSPNATSGITVNLAAGATLPANGSFIEVKTLTSAGGVITVASLEVETELHAAENQKVSIEGFVASGTADDFVVNGQQVKTNAQTVFLGGVKANFDIGRKLEAEGPIVGGIMTATTITFKVVNGGLSKGVVEKFGSVFVNGVEFKTLGAKLRLRDDKTTPDRILHTETEIADLLKPGMVVTVKGGFDNNGTTGIAQEIEFRNTLEGTIDNKGVDFITVMGQKIIVDEKAKAVFDTLVAGDKVGLSGLPDDRGQIRATHIEKKIDLAEFEAKGFISGLTGTTFTLKLDKNAASGMTVTLGSGVALPAGAVDGAFVEVRTLSVGGLVTATKVELEDELEAAENEKMEFEGFVASGTADDFIVKGQRVQTNAATVFVGGIKADFVVGMKVEAEGKVGVGGILIATKVMFNDNIRIDSIVEGAVNIATATTQANLTLLGKKVIITSATDLRGLSGATLDLATVLAGQEVQIRGFMASDGSGNIIATRVDLIKTAPDMTKFRPFLRGPVTATAAGTLTIAGITVDTTIPANVPSFRKIDDPPTTTITSAAFFSAIVLNKTVVKVTWSEPFTTVAGQLKEAELEN